MDRFYGIICIKEIFASLETYYGCIFFGNRSVFKGYYKHSSQYVVLIFWLFVNLNKMIYKSEGRRIGKRS